MTTLTASSQLTDGCDVAMANAIDRLTGNNHRMVGSSQPPQADWPRGVAPDLGGNTVSASGSSGE